jgi:hypothetical protein
MPILRNVLFVLAAVLMAGCGGGSEAPASLEPQALAAAHVPQQASAVVTPADAAELLLNAAESAYSVYFPGHQTTQTFGPFRFRYYAATNTYIGVTVTADPAYQLYSVYTVGPAFHNDLGHPALQGSVTVLLGNSITIDTGLSTGHTLTVSVTAAGITSPPVTITNVPAPNTQLDFCTGLATDTTFTQIAAGAGGSMTINSCSFNGTTGNIAATLTIVYGTFQQTFSYTITYTYS